MLLEAETEQKIDFIDIIENQLGIKTDEDYDNWAREIQKRGVTKEDIDLLSPDRVDNKAFWKYITKKFNSGICGTINNGRFKDFTQEEVNRLLYQSMGITSFLSYLHNFGYTNIAELGTGFGSLAIICEKLNLPYIGFDVAPQKGVNSIEIEDGVLPSQEEFGDKQPHVFVCFNVFQHMIRTQIENYIRQIYDILPERGYFISSFILDGPVKYTFTYGQVIPMPTGNQIYRLLDNYNFRVIQSTHRYGDGMTTLICQKLPKPPEHSEGV